MKIACVTARAVKGGRIPNGLKVAKALRSIGHAVAVLDHGQATNKANLAQAELVLAFGTLISAEEKHRGTFAGVKRAVAPGTTFALWYFDLCNPDMRNSPWKYSTMLRVAPLLDWLVMTDHSYAWERHVPHFLHLTQGVDPDDFARRPNPSEPRARDVIFTGGYLKPFSDRLQALRALQGRFSVDIFGSSNRRPIFGPAFWAQHQRARVVYVPAPPKEAACDYWSNRIYLATATGTPCVVGHTPGLEVHFKDGEEVAYFHDNRELVQKTAALVADPALRGRMGRAARARTLAEHTYAMRCKTLMAAIGGAV